MNNDLRGLLRKLIGWDEPRPIDPLILNTFKAIQEKLAELEAKVESQKNRGRDKAGAPIVITDWETIQAHYASNPDNFKEQN
jgi:hypothetical protein